MDAPFPFGLPAPTAFYLTLYLATLMVHIVFMNYVLAGSAYLAVASAMRDGDAIETNPIYDVLRDWMPFMLSAAITAGVAPLLFLQVLYIDQFYTANLLLFYRWMAILPALILGFYLAYLLKAKRVRRWALAARFAVGCGAFACFAFVGWSWVENHLLSLQPETTWATQYGSGTVIFRSPELIPRLTLWFAAAFPTMALVVGWQLLFRARDDNGKADAPSQVPGSRRTAAIAIVGIVLSSVTAGIYFSLLNAPAREAIMGTFALPYAAMAAVGGAIQLFAWIAQFARRGLARRWLLVASTGLVINFIGMAVVNESTRLATFQASGKLDTLFARQEEAFQVGGFPVFVLFLIVNAGLIAFCVRLVRK